jgi:uncharacterized coiled-coil protein SlyX
MSRSACVDLMHLFPLPTQFDLCLSIVATRSSFSNGCLQMETVQRPREEIIRIVTEMYDFMVEKSSKQVLSEDLAENLPLNLTLVPGVVDYLIAAGFDRIGTHLILNFDESGPPSQFWWGIDILREELASDGNKTKNILTNVGPLLTTFSATMDRLSQTNYNPQFSDIVACVHLRNSFYIAYLLSADDDLMSDTWADYFEQSRDAMNDCVARLEYFHRCCRCDGSAIRATHNGALLATQLSFAVSATPLGTPEEGATPVASSNSPTWLSPGDMLLRTPQHPIDRQLFFAQQPVRLEDLWRETIESEDALTPPCGLYNIRQSCFVNALLQVLVRIEPIRWATFQFPSQAALRYQKVALTNEIRVVHRLQRLFAFMVLSESSVVNAAPLLDAVADCDPRFGDGQQHDPHEFAILLHDAIIKGFDAVLDALHAGVQNGDPKDKENMTKYDDAEETFSLEVLVNARELLKNCWETTTQEILIDKSGNDRKGQHQLIDVFLPVYIDTHLLSSACSQRQTGHCDPNNIVQHYPLKFFEALGGYFTNFIDDPQSHVVGSLKILTGSVAPPMLFIYLPSRSDANGAKNRINLPFPDTFGLKMGYSQASHIQRLMFDTLAEISALNKEHALLSAAMNSIESALAFQEQTLVKASSSNLTESCNLIAKTRDTLLIAFSEHHERCKNIGKQIAKIQEEYDRLVLDFFSNDTTDSSIGNYELMSVIAHIGEKNSEGHYVAYARASSQSKEWFLLDDTKVVRATNNDVFAEKTFSQYYCLLYRERNSIDLRRNDCIPQHLRTLVDREDLRKQLKYAQRLSAAEKMNVS